MRRKHSLKDYLCMYDQGAVFTALDTETTGLYCDKDRIVEIGAVKFDKTGVLDSYEVLIHPEISVPESAYRVHGIGDSMLSACPPFVATAADLLRFTAGTRLVAHNAAFDTGFINAELQRAGYPTLQSPSVPPADTVILARKAFPALGKYNLQFLAQHFGIEAGRAHRAFDDALVCREVFLRCIAEYSKKHPAENTLF